MYHQAGGALSYYYYYYYYYNPYVIEGAVSAASAIT
jgi:hypothetical protein